MKRRRVESDDEDLSALEVGPSIGSIVQLSEAAEDDEEVPEKDPIGFIRLKERE
jgi:hypothetical protein